MAKPSISDRALIRWLERTGAMNMEELRELIATSLERAYTAASSISNGRFLVVVDSLIYVVEDGTVVTVVNDDGRRAARINRPDRSPS